MQGLADAPPGRMPALVFFYNDRFMRINDSFGYPAGWARRRPENKMRARIREGPRPR
jgi:hypothetical protein